METTVFGGEGEKEKKTGRKKERERVERERKTDRVCKGESADELPGEYKTEHKIFI